MSATAKRLSACERLTLARILAWPAANGAAPEWTWLVRPGESTEELRDLAAKLGILAEFELEVVRCRTEIAGGNANEGLLQ